MILSFFVTMFKIHTCTYVDVEIGFDRTFYQVDENVASGFAMIQIRISRGVLKIPLIVTFRTTDDTAIGKYVRMYAYTYVVLHMKVP